jgi:hypothetical protein
MKGMGTHGHGNAYSIAKRNHSFLRIYGNSFKQRGFQASERGSTSCSSTEVFSSIFPS